MAVFSAADMSAEDCGAQPKATAMVNKLGIQMRLMAAKLSELKRPRESLTSLVMETTPVPE